MDFLVSQVYPSVALANPVVRRKGLALRTMNISLDPTSLIPFRSSLVVPLSSTALIVYRLTTEWRGPCGGQCLKSNLPTFN